MMDREDALQWLADNAKHGWDCRDSGNLHLKTGSGWVLNELKKTPENFYKITHESFYEHVDHGKITEEDWIDFISKSDKGRDATLKLCAENVKKWPVDHNDCCFVNDRWQWVKNMPEGIYTLGHKNYLFQDITQAQWDMKKRELSGRRWLVV